MSEKQYRALKDALASTRMEGYTITTHTEKDCARLLRGSNHRGDRSRGPRPIRSTRWATV